MKQYLAIVTTPAASNVRPVEGTSARNAARRAAKGALKPCEVRIVDTPVRAIRTGHRNAANIRVFEDPSPELLRQIEARRPSKPKEQGSPDAVLATLSGAAPDRWSERARLTIRENPRGWPLWFVEWLVNNWHVWVAFGQLAERAKLEGRANFSARAIIQDLRWETPVEDTTKPYKINNNHSPLMARLFNEVSGEELFRTRS